MTNPTKLVPVKFKWCPSCAGCLEGSFFCATCGRDWSPVAEQAPVSGFDETALNELRSVFAILESAPEINPSNYDHEQVCELNNASTDAYLALRDFLRTLPAQTTPHPTADLIDEAAKQTIRAERLQAENDRLRKELGRAHDLAETMNGNCGEQFDRAELAEAKLAELKAWKQDWQETIDCVPFREFGEELEQIIGDSQNATAQTTPHHTAELLGLPDKWREQAASCRETGNPTMFAIADKKDEDADELQAALDKMQGSGWLPIESAPKGCVTENIGCRGESEWFKGRVAKKYRQGRPPFIVIKRRSWPSEDSWTCAGQANYVPDFFDAWMPLPTPPRDTTKQESE